MKIIKTLLKGLLYLILSPLILVGFSLYFIYSLIIFIVLFFISSYKFVSGKKLNFELKEDILAKEIIQKRNLELQTNQSNQQINQTPVVEVSTKPQTVVNNYYFSNNDNQNNNSLNTNNIEDASNQHENLIEEQTSNNYIEQSINNNEINNDDDDNNNLQHINEKEDNNYE